MQEGGQTPELSREGWRKGNSVPRRRGQELWTVIPSRRNWWAKVLSNENGSYDEMRENERVVGGAREMSRGKGVRCRQSGYVQQTRFLESLVESLIHYLKNNEKSSKSFQPKGANFFTCYMFTQTCIRTGLNLIDLLILYHLDSLEHSSQSFVAFRVLNYWTFSSIYLILTTNNIGIYRTQKEYFT